MNPLRHACESKKRCHRDGLHGSSTADCFSPHTGTASHSCPALLSCPVLPPGWAGPGMAPAQAPSPTRNTLGTGSSPLPCADTTCLTHDPANAESTSSHSACSSTFGRPISPRHVRTCDHCESRVTHRPSIDPRESDHIDFLVRGGLSLWSYSPDWAYKELLWSAAGARSPDFGDSIRYDDRAQRRDQRKRALPDLQPYRRRALGLAGAIPSVGSWSSRRSSGFGREGRNKRVMPPCRRATVMWPCVAADRGFRRGKHR
jgi:hypothetical protein